MPQYQERGYTRHNGREDQGAGESFRVGDESVWEHPVTALFLEPCGPLIRRYVPSAKASRTSQGAGLTPIVGGIHRTSSTPRQNPNGAKLDILARSVELEVEDPLDKERRERREPEAYRPAECEEGGESEVQSDEVRFGGVESGEVEWTWVQSAEVELETVSRVGGGRGTVGHDMKERW
jgi:hypothetical protein